VDGGRSNGRVGLGNGGKLQQGDGGNEREDLSGEFHVVKKMGGCPANVNSLVAAA